MSGGVDSSVAAVLLKERGFDVVGLFMNFFAGAEVRRTPGSRSCCAVEDASDARRVAATLSIPFYSLDMSADFGGIREHFVREYTQGRTPVPCTLCNRDVKFGSLLEVADSFGAHRVATGHYAIRRESEGRATLHRGVDEAKDQTYFLWPLSEEGLERCFFPVGELAKDEVREIASEHGLLTAGKPESQDLCFVPDGDYLGYLRRQGIDAHRGPIVDGDGRVVGEHEGIETVTVGQRRGLGIALGEPHYVVEIRAETNTVVVGKRESLLVRGLVATEANWLGLDPPAEPLPVDIKVRHTQGVVPGRVVARPGERLEVTFDEPANHVAPGQGVVCYQGDRVLCGGWIEQSTPA